MLGKRIHHAALMALWLFACAMIWAVPALGQRSGEQLRQFEGVELEEKLGHTIPLDLTFKNEAGETVTLDQYFDGERPVVLNLVYHECPMLCGLMLDGFTRTLNDMNWTPGGEFEVLTVSFNHREGSELAREKKAQYLERLGRPEAAGGWHFLTGSEASIEALTDAVGFDFRWVEENQEYAHPTVLIFLSGEGTVTRYLFGLDPGGSDARKALVEASNGEVGTLIDKAVLYCFQYDPNSNSYVANAFNIMRLGGVLTVVLLGVSLFVFWRRENSRLNDRSAQAASD